MEICFFPNGVGVNRTPVICKKIGVIITPIVYLTKSQCSKKSDFDLIVKYIVEHLKEIIDE